MDNRLKYCVKDKAGVRDGTRLFLTSLLTNPCHSIKITFNENICR